MGYLDSLPPLVSYARKQSSDNKEPLIVLVEQVCCKLDEEKQQCEQGDAQHIHDRSLWYKQMFALGEQICVLLNVFLKDI